MASKTKILKGFNKYISQIFDEKEDEIQIGFPTDVKHVAHIGWDGGPSTDAPSWMKDFKSAPLAPAQESKEEGPDIQWVSEDSKSKRPQKAATSNSDSSEPPKPKSEKSSRRQPRKHHSSASQQSSDSNDMTSTSSRSLPDIPRKARRKKSKEEGSTRSRRGSSTSNAGQFIDSGSDTGSVLPPPGPKMSNDHNADDNGPEK